VLTHHDLFEVVILVSVFERVWEHLRDCFGGSLEPRISQHDIVLLKLRDCWGLDLDGLQCTQLDSLRQMYVDEVEHHTHTESNENKHEQVCADRQPDLSLATDTVAPLIVFPVAVVVTHLIFI
jgi:hypothetical protein